MTSYYMPNEKIITSLNELVTLLQEKFKDSLIGYSLEFQELTIKIKKDNLLEIISFLKDDPKYLFRQLIEVTAVDYPENNKRFVLVYQLLSLAFNLRIRVKTEISENEVVPSLYSYYNNADWLEREVFDMFGIYFSNHPDLRRILTDFGFEGFPLRKDFPLSGHTEVYYDQKEQKVKYKPIKLENEYRDFKSVNPWLDLKKQ
ncbi:NADH-quinone oxidoreductase subunit C [Rickettsiales bacterium LUAb2]